MIKEYQRLPPTHVPNGFELPLLYPQVDTLNYAGEVDLVYLSAIRNLYPRILSYYFKQEDKTLLDVSCGDTRNLHYYKWKGLETIATELTDDLVENARRKGFLCHKINLNTDNLPFPDNSFDIVTCTSVLEHLLYPDYAMREIVRVTKRIALILVPVGHSYDSPDHLHHWNDAGILQKEVLHDIKENYILTIHLSKPEDVFLKFRFFLIIVDIESRMKKGDYL